MSNFKWFRQPIGTTQEIATGIVWCGYWFDATGYARRYRIGAPNEAFHTGADLNCNPPGHFDSDKLAPVYSIGDGRIIHADKYPSWGNIIVARYELEDARVIYARYAHVDGKPTVNSNGLMVKVGDRVEFGQQIARIGNAFGTMAYHLHFDISPTGALHNNPADWPKLNLARLKVDYADPKVWLQARTAPSDLTIRTVEVTAERGLNIRTYPSIYATVAGLLKNGTQVNIENIAPVLADGYHWQRIWGALPDVVDAPNRWIAIDYTKET